MGGRSKPEELATRSFEKQGDATAFFKAMLNRYRPGERVRDEDGLDVAALLERHTEYVAKVGYGVSHFQLMMTEHGTQCFRIIRKDGRGKDFSYPHCISQRPPSRKQEVAQAFRRTVRFDLYKARDSLFATAVEFLDLQLQMDDQRLVVGLPGTGGRSIRPSNDQCRLQRFDVVWQRFKAVTRGPDGITKEAI